MDRILSWKIDSSTYAYIFPIKNSYISNRIPEDSPLWNEIISKISTWTKDIYRANFDKMASEVKSKYNQTIPWQDQYWDFSDDNTNLPVNIVLLAGKDGDGNGNGSNGTGSEGGIGSYEELRDAINKELDKAKKDIEEQNKRVEEFVEQKVGETIAEAKNTIAETKKELADTREELENKLEGAAEALDKAAALFDMGEGNISGEDIKNALSSVDEYGGWLEEYSGTVKNLKTDYDLATQRMGSIGEAEDVTDGLFARFATSLNVVSGTVGNVERSMNASQGLIEDFASWYNTNASSATEASRFINAMSGQIVDSIDFISGDGLTTRLTREMNAFSGTIRDEIMTETSSAVTNVRNVLNGLSGVVEMNITRLDGIKGDLTTMGTLMSAQEGRMETYMTISDSAMALANDLRDTWSVESGKLSTVANLTAETDEKGNINYYVSGETGEEIKVEKTPEGKWVNSYGKEYSEEMVYVHWSQAIGSYIQQQASSVTISVMNTSGLTAAIQAAIKRGEDGKEVSVIELISEKLVITGDMIAGAISANTANIDGINIGEGKISSVTKDESGNPMFELDGKNGTLYAANAKISGKIIANDGKIGGFSLIGSKLMVSRNVDNTSDGDNTDYIAFLNGSNTISDSKRGTIILAAGISSGHTYHEYTSTKSAEYSTIYTKRKYAVKNGDKSGCEVEAYEYDEATKTYRRLANQFYFLTITSKDEIGDIIFSAETGDITYFTRQCVIRKYFKELKGGKLDEIVDEYSYQGETPEDEEEVTNTRIFEDGTIISNTLIANDGYFGGEINANGRFRGTLENANGTLKGATIDANLINGNIVIRDSDSIKAKSNDQLYFNVGKEPLSDTATTEFWNIDEFSWATQNSNGTNEGIWYNHESTIAYVSFKSGATITIPVLNGSIYRYAPVGHTNNDSYIWVKGNVSYNKKMGKEIINTLIPVPWYRPANKNDRERITPFKTGEEVVEAIDDGVLRLTFGYNVHLSTYKWAGADKSYASLKFNTGGSKITVKYEKPTKGVSIASNGMRVLTVSGASVTILDDKITMLSPSEKFGLRITNSGVEIRKEGTWKPL